MLRVESIKVDSDYGILHVTGVVFPVYSNALVGATEITYELNGEMTVCGSSDFIKLVNSTKEKIVGKVDINIHKKFFICPWSYEAVKASEHIKFDRTVSVTDFVDAHLDLREKALATIDNNSKKLASRNYATMPDIAADPYNLAVDSCLFKAIGRGDSTGLCYVEDEKNAQPHSNVIDLILKRSDYPLWYDDNKLAVLRYYTKDDIYQTSVPAFELFKYDKKFLKFVLACS